MRRSGKKFISRKTQYALRAIFELSKRYGEGPVKIHQIAGAQAIPPRFLEVILAELKGGGFVDSQRGSEGGYHLVRSPEALSVGEAIRFNQGPLQPVRCGNGGYAPDCPLLESCVFLPMWKRVHWAISEVFDSTSFAELAQKQKESEPKQALFYTI